MLICCDKQARLPCSVAAPLTCHRKPSLARCTKFERPWTPALQSKGLSFSPDSVAFRLNCLDIHVLTVSMMVLELRADLDFVSVDSAEFELNWSQFCSIVLLVGPVAVVLRSRTAIALREATPASRTGVAHSYAFYVVGIIALHSGPSHRALLPLRGHPVGEIACERDPAVHAVLTQTKNPESPEAAFIVPEWRTSAILPRKSRRLRTGMAHFLCRRLRKAMAFVRTSKVKSALRLN